MQLTEAILAQAKAEARKLMDGAKLERERRLKKAKEDAKAVIDRALADAKNEGRAEAMVEATRISRRTHSNEMADRKEVFDDFRRAVENGLRKNPKALFEKAVKEAKHQFKQPVVEAGPSFVPVLKQMRVAAKSVKGLDGMRIGQDGVWLSVEIRDMVDQYFEIHYADLLESLFGG